MTDARYVHWSHRREAITSEAFSSLSSRLVRLDLSFNNLFTLPSLAGLPQSLQELWLNDNPLTDLSPGRPWAFPELRLLDISRTLVRKCPSELGQLPKLRIVAENCEKLKPGHADVAFLATKSQRHALLDAITDKIGTSMYATENFQDVRTTARRLVREVKREFSIDDYKRLLHSPDRFLGERMSGNSADSLKLKMAEYKGRSPHAPGTSDERDAATETQGRKPQIMDETNFRLYDKPIVLDNQRPLWQTLQWL